MTPADQHALREALARAEAERDEAERGKAAALGLQNGGALIIRQLEAERDALTGQRDELQGLIVTAEICAERAIARALAAEAENTRLKETVEAAATRFEDIAAGRAFQPQLHAATGATEARSALATIPPKENPDA